MEDKEYIIETHLLNLTEELCKINKQTRWFHFKLRIIELIVDNLTKNNQTKV